MARTAWAWMVLPIEVKVSDPGFQFDLDRPENIRDLNVYGPKGRAQHAMQVAEVMLRQHRTHVFSLYIYRNFARIFLWDRAGILVSTPFDFVQRPELLLNFVYRFSRLSRALKGYDTSAKLATKEEIKILRDFLKSKREPKDEAEWKAAKSMLEKKLVYPIYKVRLISH